MLRENLKDSGEIVDNILTQSLSIPGIDKEISLLEAAQNFNPQHADASDLRKIIQSFLLYPEPTEMMLREMEILQEDLN